MSTTNIYVKQRSSVRGYREWKVVVEAGRYGGGTSRVKQALRLSMLRVGRGLWFDRSGSITYLDDAALELLSRPRNQMTGGLRMFDEVVWST